MGEIIAVDSVVYNMAGDEKDRPQYLKSLVVQNVLSGTKAGMGDTLRSGYLNGPAIQLRAFYRWASVPANYGTVGLPTGGLQIQGSLDPELVGNEIPHGAGVDVWVLTAHVGYANHIHWAEQWILVNRPDDFDAGWTADYDETTNKITIVFGDATTQIITPTGFDSTKRYVYAYHQLGIGDVFGSTLLFIYRIGSGNAYLDTLVITDTEYGEFFPFIPIRLNNKFLSETYLPGTFAQVKKAYKKATGAKLTKLIEQLKDNESIGDIDHAYVTFGVSLNVVEKSCKKYLYRFFEKLQISQSGGLNVYAAWQAELAAKKTAIDAYLAWWDAQDPKDGSGPGTEMPPRPTFSLTTSNQIRIRGTGEVNSRFDVRLQWTFITNGSGTGLGKTGAKKGDLWFQVVGEDPVAARIDSITGSGFFGNAGYADKIRLYWQKTATSYTYLDITGAVYRNYIYSGRQVTITARVALQDPDESGFIIPLHYDTWRETSLVDSSQMATACVFVVFNCYEVHKTKWYESGIFKVLLVIVIAIASAVFAPAGIGLLGAHLSVGVSLGFSGMTAAIVGSIANALVAMVLVTILGQLVAGMGPLGQIIAVVVMFVVGQLASSFHSTGTAVLNWGDMLRVDNLLKLTDAAGRGVAQMFNDNTMSMMEDWSDFAEKAAQETNKIQQAYFEEFGYGGGLIDPFMFVDSTKLIAESSDTFLTRTLMTGSEIAEMSRELLYDFPSLSLKLPDAFT